MVGTDFCSPLIGRSAGCPVSAGRALGKGGVQRREERNPRCSESTTIGRERKLGKTELRVFLVFDQPVVAGE